MSTDTADLASGESPTEQPPAGPATQWRFGPAALVVMLVGGLLAGVAIGVLVTLPRHPADDSPEAGFAREMMIHHGQAVSMGMIAYENASVRQVRTLGMQMALAQQGEIGMMRQWLREWGLLATGSEPPMAWMAGSSGVEHIPTEGGLMPGMATQEQMAALREAEGVEVDRLFLELMINHHLGGLHMIDAILDLSDHPEVTRLAGRMKDVHHRELVVLRDLQARIAED